MKKQTLLGSRHPAVLSGGHGGLTHTSPGAHSPRLLFHSAPQIFIQGTATGLASASREVDGGR
jgi:hypothetical protein